ncbi:MAG: ATP synthase F0 subunit B [Acidobacteriota bacterium]
MTFPLGFAENSIQLVPDGTLLLHILIILVMVYVLNATLFKPINRILEAREKRTRGRLSEAQEILRSVSEKLSHYERSLRQSRGEAYAFAEHERTRAMQERQLKVAEMRKQLAESTAKEKEAIQRQAEAARGLLETEARRIAREIGSRILSRPISDAEMN